MNTEYDRDARVLAGVLTARRRDVADAFAQSLAFTPKWSALMSSKRADWEGFLKLEFYAFVDYLIEYFRRGDATFQQLFLGETIKSLYDPQLDAQARKSQVEAVGTARRTALESLLGGDLSPTALGLLTATLESVDKVLAAQAPKTQRILLIGDCLFLDIVPFAVGELLQAGVAIIPEYVTSKSPLELRDQLRKLSSEHFDLVFFSPFTYEFSPTFAQLTHWRNAFMRADTLHQSVHDLWREAEGTLDVIVDLFDCPIHVHNSAAIIRDESAAKRAIKLKVTSRMRAAVKRQINDALLRYVEHKNAQSFKHVFVLDEDALVREAGEFQAGAYYYKTELQHPAVMGPILARRYVDIIFVNAHLLKKKLVVCDLDNTLWKGVIGEGPVAHWHDRQGSLKQLKSKGVVLAVNSKNDPANVHWRGGTLCDDDFVCSAISWEPKVRGMKQIQDVLNLKLKDFVFIDDREDERQLMQMTYPEVLCLDAEAAQTWTRFALWREFLEEDMEMDRTLMYKQREQRKAFIKEDASSEEEKLALFKALELKLAITEAVSSDLKRVSELINRTNQFNLEGSRTSLKEVTEWHQSPKHVILTGQSGDRFGDMGTTCVAVAKIDGGVMEVLPFVLSCRVFGYGIERAVMNCLKSLARQRGASCIIGRFIPTAHNAPSKDFLAANGFSNEGSRWVFDLSQTKALADVPWLSVSVSADLSIGKGSSSDPMRVSRSLSAP